MDKTKASKKPTPSLRTKKKGSTDRQKSSSRPSGFGGSKNATSTKQAKKEASQHSKRDTKNAGRSVMVMDREPTTDNNEKAKKKETPPPPPKKEVKKRVSSVEAEKKLDRTQEDVQDAKAGATETISNIEVLPDKNPAKMDDGYEDFGPGAAS